MGTADEKRIVTKCSSEETGRNGVGFETRQLLWLFALKVRDHMGDVIARRTVILKWNLEE
jgi:hypothetical protein